MVYTTYIDKIKKLPTNSLKLIVMRYRPNINLFEVENVKFLPSLSPSSELLFSYKNNEITFKEFSLKFRKQIENDLKALKLLEKIKHTKCDVFLICCEKSQFECHRSILSNILNEMGCECKEF